MLNIELGDIINTLGQPERKLGNELQWQCPICQDKSKNNLMYNPRKRILWCFANESHSKIILKEICKRNKFQFKSEVYKKSTARVLTSERMKEFYDYMIACNKKLLNSHKYLKFLEQQRSIKPNTVKYCFIGIDFKKLRFVFPTIAYSADNKTNVIGFEYRPLNLSKQGLYREKNTPTGLAQINSFTNKTKTLAILEGCLDGYAFYQHLKEIGQNEFYHIVTPSNGVSSILRLLDDINSKFSNYKEIYAYLDSDEAGIRKMREIEEKYPNIKIHIMTCGCKDFNEHYQKCLITPRLPHGNKNVPRSHHG